jgi:hypothetical protein
MCPTIGHPVYNNAFYTSEYSEKDKMFVDSFMSFGKDENIEDIFGKVGDDDSKGKPRTPV